MPARSHSAALVVSAALLAAPVISQGVSAAATRPTTVYTMSNATAVNGGNVVHAYYDYGSGVLTPAGTYPTGGYGLGAGLGSQGAVTLSVDETHLAVVNAGSDDVSVFAVGNDGRLSLQDRKPTAGSRPVSAAFQGDRLYVLNAGSNSVAGFSVGTAGLTPIPGSVRSLSPGADGAAQVSVTPDGAHLLVT